MGADCDEVLLGQDELQCAWMNRKSGRRTAGDGGQGGRGARRTASPGARRRPPRG